MTPFETAQQIRNLADDLKNIDIYEKLTDKERIEISINMLKIYWLDKIDTRLMDISDAI